MNLSRDWSGLFNGFLLDPLVFDWAQVRLDDIVGRQGAFRERNYPSSAIIGIAVFTTGGNENWPSFIGMTTFESLLVVLYHYPVNRMFVLIV